MQTQFQQGSKKNKVVVPFYTPPTRLYGQTPAEIIKEARAAVMPTPALGIKPVFTNRPFTPKDNERTLFGSFKRKNKWQSPLPTSEIIHNSDTTSQVKLPSIESASKRKSHSIFHYSNNVSLDNLAEDYDAEVLEEEIGELNVDKLPNWKKSHSCPKEGRMVKAASYNDLNQRLFSARGCSWNASATDENERHPISPSGRISQPEKRESKEKHKKSSISTIFKENYSQEVSEQPRDFYHFVEMTKGCGDHEQTVTLDANLLMNKNIKTLSKQLLSKHERGDHSTEQDDLNNVKTNVIISENKSVKTTEEIKSDVHKGKSTQETVKKSKEVEGKFNIESENKAKPKAEGVPSGTSAPVEKKEDVEEVIIKESVITGRSQEKSIGTGYQSEYLLRMKEGTRKEKPEIIADSVPLEILELYQIAEHYGIDLTGKGTQYRGRSAAVNETHKQSRERHKLESKVKASASEENVNSYPTLEKKVGSSIGNSTDKVEYVMNDRIRYHVVGDKKGGREKAYEKWLEKEQKNASSPTTESSSLDGGWDLFWKNCYYERKKEQVKVEETMSEKSDTAGHLEALQRLINKSTDLFKLGGESSLVYDINCQLYQLLRNSTTALESTVKNKILKVVSLHSENEDPRLQLSIARLIFYLKIDSSLTAGCKMIFNVARFDTNDHLFMNEEDILELFMEGIGRASPLEYAESCIYGYGALKFLTMNYNILSRTLHMGALDLMTLHLKLINTACAESGGVKEQTQQALFQLTGVLRHVAAGEGALPLFITTNCISVICKNLELFQKDEDIVTNISRTLSLVSTNENIIQVLMSVENILPLVIGLMERYKENDKILIRLSFCLGNIVEHNDLARIQLLRSDTSLSTLLNILKFYIDKDLEISTRKNEENGLIEPDSEVVDDVIVKIIRIIANMSMNPIVGSNLTPVAKEKKSLQLSQLLSVLLLRKDPGITLLATLGCLNNVSYYCNSHSALIDITQGIERVLGLQSEDCQAEAARVLGNLTRHKEIRDLIYNTGGVNQLIKLLTSKDHEVVRCACGALVNMLLDPESRKQFLESGGIDKLVDAMELFSGDWSLASLSGRAIWNSCADDLSSAALHNNLERLLNTLATSLEEENWKDGDAAWEEFASIATDLLEKINTHLECGQ